jgi:hypothetical protein
MADGNLRAIFAKRIPEAHWQSVETWSTGRGVPDINYCLDGIEGWIEAKRTATNAVGMRPEQVAWIEMRVRAGGRVFIAVRKMCEEGPRKGPAIDALYLFAGQHVRHLLLHGLPQDARPWHGGPSKWDWELIRKTLRGFQPIVK